MAIEGVVAAAAAAAVTVTVAVAAAATAAAAAVPLSDRYIDGGGGGREDMSHVHTRPAEPQTPDDNDASNRIESGQQLQVQVQVQVQVQAQGRVQAQTQAQVPVAMWNLMEDQDRALEEDDVKERRRRRYYYCQVDCNSDGYRDALRFERTRTTKGEVWWREPKTNDEGG